MGGTYIGEPHPDYDMWGADMLDEAKYRLNQIAPEEKSKFVYEYDFGDSWEHVIVVEKIFPPEKGVRYPRCIKGKRACPPEDVGGVWGYDDFVEAVKNPNHPNTRLCWIGGATTLTRRRLIWMRLMTPCSDSRRGETGRRRGYLHREGTFDLPRPYGGTNNWRR